MSAVPKYAADWIEKQRAFVAERDAARAERCECGHDRDSHTCEVANCRRCKCGSFKAAQP